jgi:hypothetical protein
LLPAITGTTVTARINRLVNQFLSVDIDGSLLFLTQLSGLSANMGRKATSLSQTMSRKFTQLCLEQANSLAGPSEWRRGQQSLALDVPHPGETISGRILWLSLEAKGAGTDAGDVSASEI